MRKFVKLLLGNKSIYVNECRKGSFIGLDYQIKEDLSGKFPDKWRDFNREYIPVYMKNNPNSSKIAAGLACGTIWMLFNYYWKGDIVISPVGNGNYIVGEICGEYEYKPEQILPHRRSVKWFSNILEKAMMSEGLSRSASSGATYCDLAKHSDEIEKLIGTNQPPQIIIADTTIESTQEFAMEKHLEDFLVKNWSKTILGKDYDLYEEAGNTGQQFPTDTGPIDILALSKDKKTILVIELKKGRASDYVLGQIQRYMGYVKDELSEKNQQVKGLIIGFDKDNRLKRALSVANDIDFMRYEINFKLKEE